MKNLSTAVLALLFVVGLSACTSASKTDENMGDGTDLLASDTLPSDTDQASAPPAEAPLPVEQPLAETTQEEPKHEVAENVPPPVEESKPVAEAKPSVGEQSASYRVQKGDTLMKIAYEKYGDLYQWKKILELNSDVVGEMKKLTEGMVLKLDSSVVVDNNQRNGERYLIKHGDTLGSISDDVYGTEKKWRKIWDNNKPLIKDPNKIYAGFFIYYLMNEQDRIELTKYRQEKGATDSPREPASK